MSQIKLGSHVGMAGKEMFLCFREGGGKLRRQYFNALYRSTAEYKKKRDFRTEY